MNNLKTTDLGGLPFKLDDLRFIHASVLDAFKGVMSTYGVSNSQAVILSGCTKTTASGTTSIAQGYISIGGEICFVPAHSYPNPSVGQVEYWDIDVSYDPAGLKQFQNTTPHDTYEVRVGKVKVASSVPSGYTSLSTTKTIYQIISDNISVMPTGGIIMWSGTIVAIPTGWVLCDGANGTPNLRDRFIVGAGSTYNVGDTGGQSDFTISNTNLPQHTHPTSHNLKLPDHEHFYDKPNQNFFNGNEKINADSSMVDILPMPVGELTGGIYNTNMSIPGSVTVQNGGGVASPSAIDNKPPYYALAYIMKV